MASRLRRGLAAVAAPALVFLVPLKEDPGDPRLGLARCDDAAACAQLRRDGFAVIPLAAVGRAATYELATTLDSARLRRAAVEVTAGRLHLELTRRRDADARDIVATIDARVAPPLRALAARYLETDRVRLTQAQFLDSAPGAVAQHWHRDNARPGVTFLVPLENIDVAMGPTELLPTSHSEGGAPASETRLLRCAPLGVDDVLVYDARLLHRGGANASETKRRVLVLRFDDPKTPPPGVGAAGSLLQRATGGLWSRAAGVLHDVRGEA